MKRHSYTVTLKIRGPILTKSSSPASFGIDSAVARVATGPNAGTPCIHGSLVKGKVLEALLQLGYKEGDVALLLGEESESRHPYNPIRGTLAFSDAFVAQETKHSNQFRSRISIENDLGSVKGEALQVIETPYLPGQEVTFTGTVHYYGTESGQAATKLLQALRWNVQVGANRSIGFGRILQASITPLDTTPTGTPTRFDSDISGLDISLEPLGPLCISRHKIGGNLFESGDVIPGNMLAGAIRQTAVALGISNFPDLFRHFDEIRFRHAFPSTDHTRPPAIPLSLVREGEDPYDLVDQIDSSPLLLPGKKASPRFILDWKESDWNVVSEKFPSPRPARELRVRTAIDSEHRTADKGSHGEGGALFAWDLIHPWTISGDLLKWKTQIDLPATIGNDRPNVALPLTWKTQIDLPATIGDDRPNVALQLESVIKQLGFLSKTKTICSAGVKPAGPYEEPPKLKSGDSLRMVLRTPAILADPRFQSVDSGNSGHI
ncbi:MAG: RAMP superfamily CRISPR-associated protein, partial [Verrucomicrobiota bacterium]